MLKTVLSLGANGSMEGKGAAEDIALLCMILELARVYELCMRHYSLSALVNTPNCGRLMEPKHDEESG